MLDIFMARAFRVAFKEINKRKKFAKKSVFIKTHLTIAEIVIRNLFLGIVAAAAVNNLLK
jgi:hypothetical protein